MELQFFIWYESSIYQKLSSKAAAHFSSLHKNCIIFWNFNKFANFSFINFYIYIFFASTHKNEECFTAKVFGLPKYSAVSPLMVFIFSILALFYLSVMWKKYFCLCFQKLTDSFETEFYNSSLAIQLNSKLSHLCKVFL